MDYVARRNWRITYLVETTASVDVYEAEITAHSAWAAAMHAQRKLGCDSRSIIKVEEID